MYSACLAPAQHGPNACWSALGDAYDPGMPVDVRTEIQIDRHREPTREGPFPMETSYDWADTPEGGTLMTLRNRGEPSGFGKVSAPIMAAAMRRANRKDLARL